MSEKAASSMAEAPGIGLPANAPARPIQPASYLLVHDMPPARSALPLTAIEQKQFEDDLLAAQKEQQKQAAAPAEPGYIEPDPPAPAPAPPPPPKKAAKKNAAKPPKSAAKLDGKPTAAQPDPAVTAASAR